jgi:hypothetical protein
MPKANQKVSQLPVDYLAFTYRGSLKLTKGHIAGAVAA